MTVWKQTIDYINQHGWCQSMMEDDYGRVCLVGGLGKALALENSYDAVGYDRFSAAIKTAVEFLGLPVSEPSGWNDEPLAGDHYERSLRVKRQTVITGWNDDVNRKQYEVLQVLQQLHEKAVANGREC